MRACNCGETLRSSVQKNAAETKAAIKTRLHSFERANVLIALRACPQRAYRASKFPGRDAAARRPYQLVAGFSARVSPTVKSDVMIMLGNIAGCGNMADIARERTVLNVRLPTGGNRTEIELS